MLRRRKPEDVFVPDDLALGNLFRSRLDPRRSGVPLEQRLREILERPSSQFLVFGEAGTGKSTLLEYVAREMRLSTLRFPCARNSALENILGYIEAEKQVSRDVGRSATGGTGLLSLGRTNQRHLEVRQRPFADELYDLLMSREVNLLYLENFHKIEDPAVQTGILEAMENFYDRSSREYPGPHLAALGSHETLPEIVLRNADEGIARRVSEFRVPRMSDNEIREILIYGYSYLSLEVAVDELEEMVHATDGFPYFGHQLGLYTSKGAIGAGSSTITAPIVRIALNEVSQEHSAKEGGKLRRAIESRSNTRKVLLLLLAQDRDRRSWTTAEATELWFDSLPEMARSKSAIGQGLNQLSRREYGGLLRHDLADKCFRFAGPRTRVYLRALATASEPGEWAMLEFLRDY